MLHYYILNYKFYLLVSIEGPSKSQLVIADLTTPTEGSGGRKLRAHAGVLSHDFPNIYSIFSNI